MPFQKILVALDGSKNSQIAAEYGFWLASYLDAKLAGQNVIDPRLVDLFIEPEFAEELGYSQSVETTEKVFMALRKIGKTILELFATEAAVRNLKTTTFLAEGHIVEEILKYSEEHDLLIVGHRGRLQPKLPTRLMIGSVAERIAAAADVPVLITVEPVDKIESILVAFDGSESSKGALLMAERLAKHASCKLQALTVIPSEEKKAEGHLLIQQGQGYLREYWPEEVFALQEGLVAKTILDYAAASHSLLVIGAYGFGDRDKNALGSNTSSVIRRAKNSVLIYKPPMSAAKRMERKSLSTVMA